MGVKEIVEANISFVSLVGKGANGKDFMIVKSGDATPNVEKQAPILKVDEEKRLVTGIVYEPDAIDSQSEFMSAAAIEKAAHAFLSDCRNIDRAHTFQAENVQVVESYVAKSEHTIGDTVVKEGSWVMTTHIADDEIWGQVKKGELNAYSMGGTGKRIERPDITPPVVKTSDENEVRGFFQVIKDFFSGAATTANDFDSAVGKAKENEPPTDFASVVNARQANEALDNARWTLSDVMRNILVNPTITDKSAAIGKQIDAYKAFVLAQLKSLGVEKAAEMLSEPVEKAGKKISAERLNHIKAAHAALQNILSEVEAPEEGEQSMNKSDFENVLKEALTPFDERLKKLENPDQQDPAADTQQPGAGELTAEVVKAAVVEAMKPIEDRLTTLERSRGIKKSGDEATPEDVQKETPHYLTGIL